MPSVALTRGEPLPRVRAAIICSAAADSSACVVSTSGHKRRKLRARRRGTPRCASALRERNGVGLAHDDEGAAIARARPLRPRPVSASRPTSRRCCCASEYARSRSTPTASVNT